MAKLSKVSEECRAFVEVIEELVHERKHAAEQMQQHGGFRIGDFTDKFQYYVMMRQGRTKYPPPRKDVLEMASFLHCSPDETNRLLAAAHYALEEDYLQGNDLEKALDTAQRLLHLLPFPAYAVTRDYNIHRWNSSINTLFNIEEEVISQTPLPQRNVLRYIFDPTTTVFPVLSRDYKWWRFTAALNIHRFKKDNLLCDHEDWYKQRVQSLMDFPYFEEIWNKVDADTNISQFAPQAMPAPDYVTVVFGPQGETVKIRGLQIRFLDTEFPRIVAYIPDDAVSQAVYTKYGLPTPDNWWGNKPS